MSLCTQFCWAQSADADSLDSKALLTELFSATKELNQNPVYYRADFYFRNYVNARKRNLLCLFLPNSDYFLHHGRELLHEDYGEVTYDQLIGFQHNTQIRSSSEPGEYLDNDATLFFVKVHPYQDFILDNFFISPLLSNNAKYYCYQVDSLSANNIYFSYKQRHKNTQTVNGDFIYSRTTKRVTTFHFKGQCGFNHIDETVTMGNTADELYLPVKIDIDYKYLYFWNHFDCKAVFKPHYLNTGTNLLAFNLTPAFTNNTPIDMSEYRLLPLDTLSQRLYRESYERHYNPEDTVVTTPIATEEEKPNFWQQSWNVISLVGDFIVSSHRVNTSKNSHIYFPPRSINWSPSRGITLRQDAEFIANYSNGKRLIISPSIGYNFKPNELVGKMNFTYEYSTKHGGMVYLEGGSRAMTVGASEITTIGKRVAECDTLYGDNPELTFSDNYINLGNRLEVFNGMFVWVGAMYHWRKPFHMDTTMKQYLEIKNDYRSLASRITLEYTPGQHYFINNSRKVAMNSGWPTFTIDFEKAIRGPFGSNASYERWEGMMSRIVKMKHMKKMMLKIGAGMFTKQENVDFTSYEYFNNGVTDYNWNDDFTGVFQLLDGKYYYDSKHYLRGHIAYESPTIFLRPFNTYIISSERLYVSALLTEGLAPYIELGYGISTHLVDISVFCSYIKHEPLNIEAKFSINIMK